MNPTSDSILIIGSGFAGLCAAIELKQAGIDDFTILERGDDVGGTWRDNHYPGAACDIPSHLYSFSFDPNPTWSRAYAEQKEILGYLRNCAEKYGIRPHIQFGCTVVGLRFDESDSTWAVKTSDGLVRRARIVVSSSGGLGSPKLPTVPGLERFAGKVFHSARWDHAYALEGKTVGVIGTGASAIQIVPAIAARVARMHVFQRTPPWVVAKPDRKIGVLEQGAMAVFPFMQRAARAVQYWQHESRALVFKMEKSLLHLGEWQALQYLRASVPDVHLRQKLTPNYRLGCKRILISNDYYPALQRENVELVTDPIREVTGDSIVSSDGTRRPVDAIVCATGFEAADSRTPFDIVGRGGRDLNVVWKDGQEAYLGTAVSGFPNLFMIIGPNTGVGHNSMVIMMEAQAKYILRCVQHMRRRGLRYVDVRPEVQTRYNEKLQERLKTAIWASGCDSWYLTRSGKNTSLFPGFSFEFSRQMRAFRAGDYLTQDTFADPTPPTAANPVFA